MNAGPTAERIYNGVRSMLLNGDVRPGARLDPSDLSAKLGSSVTPVREALCVLEGEGLVETRTSGGFYVRAIDAVGLADLYLWAGEVMEVVTRNARRSTGWPHTMEVDPEGEAADRMASLCDALALTSPNEEHRRAVAGLNARLRPVRIAEHDTLPDTQIEIAQLEEAFRTGDLTLLRTLLRRYHQRRHRTVSAILRTLLRGAGNNREIRSV